MLVPSGGQLQAKGHMGRCDQLARRLSCTALKTWQCGLPRSTLLSMVTICYSLLTPAAQVAFVEWLCAQLRRPAHPTRSALAVVNALGTLLREGGARQLFTRAGETAGAKPHGAAVPHVSCSHLVLPEACGQLAVKPASC